MDGEPEELESEDERRLGLEACLQAKEIDFISFSGNDGKPQSVTPKPAVKCSPSNRWRREATINPLPLGGVGGIKWGYCSGAARRGKTCESRTKI